MRNETVRIYAHKDDSLPAAANELSEAHAFQLVLPAAVHGWR